MQPYPHTRGGGEDVTPDGERFLVIKESEQQVNKIHVVLNWFQELKRLVPTNQFDPSATTLASITSCGG